MAYHSMGMKRNNNGMMKNMAMKRMMPKNRVGRKKGPMMARMEQMMPEDRREDVEEKEMEPERENVRKGIERMRRSKD